MLIKMASSAFLSSAGSYEINSENALKREGCAAACTAWLSRFHPLV